MDIPNDLYGKSKSEIISILENDSRYSERWIELASSILYNYTFISIDELNSVKDPDVLQYILDVLDGFDKYDIIHILLKYQLNASQMLVLIEGYKHDIPIELLELLASKHIPYKKLDYILQSIVDGHDMLNLIPNIDDFNVAQIYELYAGIKMGIDYTKYMDPSISDDLMRISRFALAEGRTITNGKYLVTIE